MKAGVVIGEGRTTWYPRAGTRTFRTLRLSFTAAGISHDYDTLCLRIKVGEKSEFHAILGRILASTYEPVDLAAKMEVKAFDKFDELLPESLLNEMNARDRIDLARARITLEGAFDFTRRQGVEA